MLGAGVYDNGISEESDELLSSFSEVGNINISYDFQNLQSSHFLSKIQCPLQEEGSRIYYKIVERFKLRYVKQKKPFRQSQYKTYRIIKWNLETQKHQQSSAY